MPLSKERMRERKRLDRLNVKPKIEDVKPNRYLLAHLDMCPDYNPIQPGDHFSRCPFVNPMLQPKSDVVQPKYDARPTAIHR